MNASVTALREEKAKLDKVVSEARESKPESEHRFELLRQYEDLKRKKEELTASLDSLRERDPETIRKLKDSVKLAIDGANRWTDNIYSVRSFLVRKQGMAGKEVDQVLEITEDFDSLEYPAFLQNYIV